MRSDIYDAGHCRRAFTQDLVGENVHPHSRVGAARICRARRGPRVAGLLLKFRDAPEVTTWLSGPFNKVVCKVTDEEFEAAKAFEDRMVLTESALAGQEVAIAFRPRAEWPRAFKFSRLFR